MYTLMEAIASGRKFKRAGSTGAYGIPATFGHGDVVATDYVLEPAAITLSAADLATAWDEVADEFTNVKPSASSPLFAKLVAALFE